MGVRCAICGGHNTCPLCVSSGCMTGAWTCSLDTGPGAGPLCPLGLCSLELCVDPIQRPWGHTCWHPIPSGCGERFLKRGWKGPACDSGYWAEQLPGLGLEQREVNGGGVCFGDGVRVSDGDEEGALGSASGPGSLRGAGLRAAGALLPSPPFPQPTPGRGAAGERGPGRRGRWPWRAVAGPGPGPRPRPPGTRPAAGRPEVPLAAITMNVALQELGGGDVSAEGTGCGMRGAGCRLAAKALRTWGVGRYCRHPRLGTGLEG